jgi:hypothetical protein
MRPKKPTRQANRTLKGSINTPIFIGIEPAMEGIHEAKVSNAPLPGTFGIRLNARNAVIEAIASTK